ncbi:hypothetical protein FRC10_003403 [Ceratobasidium sp. 414]|nr:hypothetical protein FRC10_003403 [Ceratobasidium sp. 414]
MDLIKGSSHLQYLLELDSLGYSAPLHPRSDISYDEKIKLLRRMRDPSGQSVDMASCIDLDLTPPVISNCQFARGVFAQGEPSLDVVRSLRLYQLSSSNKNTSYEHWQLSNLGVNAHDFKIDPDLDLLVLLEADPAPGDPDTDLIRRFHIRSLRTGLPHPLAAVPVIVSPDKFTSTFVPASFQIVGRFVALLSYTNQLLSSDSPRISVWDWTTGDLVTFADVAGNCFAFTSDTCFVIGRDRRRYATEVIGSLEVYTFDPSRPGRRARHIASLLLPTTPEGPCHASSHFVFVPFGSLSFSANGFAPSTVPPRIYDLSPSSHYICLNIRAYHIQNYPSEMPKGTLFIPAASILDAISNISSRGSNVRVPWENWARGTSWTNSRGVRGEACHIFGRRAAFVQYGPDLPAWQILVYDLGLGLQARLEDHMVLPLHELSGGHLYLDKVFLDGRCGARNPAVISLATISGAGGVHLLDDLPDVMMDDEHGEF